MALEDSPHDGFSIFQGLSTMPRDRSHRFRPFLFGLCRYMLALKRGNGMYQQKVNKEESTGDKDLPWPQCNTVLGDKSVGWA